MFFAQSICRRAANPKFQSPNPKQPQNLKLVARYFWNLEPDFLEFPWALVAGIWRLGFSL